MDLIADLWSKQCSPRAGGGQDIRGIENKRLILLASGQTHPQQRADQIGYHARPAANQG